MIHNTTKSIAIYYTDIIIEFRGLNINLQVRPRCEAELPAGEDGVAPPELQPVVTVVQPGRELASRVRGQQ